MKNCFIILFPIYINGITLMSLPDASHMKNGYKLNISEVPFYASVWINKESLSINLCGGAVIHGQAVLSAAYCFGNERKSINDNNTLINYLKVVVGTVYYSDSNVYNISKVIIHEKAFVRNFENNIALVVTAKSMLQTESVKLIAYPPQNYQIVTGTQAIVYGIENFVNNNSSTTVLLAAQVHVTKQEFCENAYTGIINVTSDMLCAVSTDPQKGPCSKDSGGPLVGNGYLIGIVSLGTACGLSTHPGIYVNVAYYYDWVETKLKNEFQSPPKSKNNEFQNNITATNV